MTNPRFQDAPQMMFRQGYEPVQTLPTNGPDNAFADRICRRAAWRRFQHLDSEPFYRLVEVFGKNAIAIVKQVFVSLLEPNGLTQLLQRPGGTGMGGDVAMDQAPAVVLDHNKDVHPNPELQQQLVGDPFLAL
jgi:hypothetical protein